MNRELAERCKGRWPDILRRLGILSSAALAGKDVPCPMCGGHDRFRFSDKGFGRWFCRGCGQGGDGVRLVQAIKRVDFARRPRSSRASSARSLTPPPTSGGERPDAPKDPMKSWRNAGPCIRNSAADIYLKRRGLDLTDDEARRLTLLAGAVALADQDALAGDAGAGGARLTGERHHHPSDLHRARRQRQGGDRKAPPVRRRR